VIRSLAYLGFTSPNVGEWRTFGPEILGAQVVDATDAHVRLRIDDAAWRLAIHEGEANDVAYIGWDVGGAADLATAVAALTDAGLEIVDGDGQLADERSVDGLVWFTDPFGFRHELAYGQRQAREPFAPGRELDGGFVTGAGGMGHIVLMVPDFEAANEFFVNTLGFSHSDDVEMGVQVRFLHCNPRHHTVAFTAVPGMVGLHHLMLEVEQPNDVGRAYDIVNERSLPIAMTLGRHTNDEMFSFYVRTPSGFEIEYGSGGRLMNLDEPEPAGLFDAQSIWGHRPPAERLFPGILRKIQS